MSEVSNEVTIIGGDGSRFPHHLVAAASIRSYVSDDENITYVIVGTDDGLVRDASDWKKTDVPGPDAGVVAILTDRRITFVVGACRDPEVEGDYVRRVHYAAVDDVEYKNSLLSTSFRVSNDDGVDFSLTPEATDGLEEICTFIRRASTGWNHARGIFEDLESELPDLESAIADGDENAASQQRNSLFESLSQVGKSSSLNSVELPALNADRDRAKDHIMDAFCRGYWRRARDLTLAGDDHRDAGDPAAAAEAYRDACEAYRGLVEERGPVYRSFDDDALGGELTPFVILETLTDRLDTVRQELSNADVETELAGLPAVQAGYDLVESAIAHGRNRLEVDPDALASRVDESRQRIADAYERCAERSVERGDEAPDDGDGTRATEQYQHAIDALTAHRQLAESNEDVRGPDSFEERRTELDEKVERAQWEWVGDE